MFKVTRRCRPAVILLTCLASHVLAQTEDLYFPASAYAVGASSSFFVHEVEVFNPLNTDETFRLYWLPRNQNNSSATFADVPVESGQAVRFGNILADVFGLTPAEVGALRVAPSTGDLHFHSTVINTSAGGTLGQIIPAVPESAAFTDTEAATILHLGEDNDQRTNVFCVNTTGSSLTMSIDLLSATGALLQENWSFVLEPWSSLQVNLVYQQYAPIDGYLRIDSATAGGKGICLGSVVNNLTNDPLTEPAVKAADAAPESYVPLAASTATESTDLSLFAPGGAALARIDLLRSGIDNTVPLTIDVPVAAGQEVRLIDLLDGTFGHSGTGALRLTAVSGELLASSQTAISVPTGEMLRSVPPIATAGQFASGDMALLIHLTESVDVRTDIGAVNSSADPLDLVISLHDATGTALGSIPLHLQPFGHDQIDAVFAAAGHPNVPDGFATVRTTTSAGSFFAYATVTDLRTNDAYHVKPETVYWLVFSDDFESGDTSAWNGDGGG